MRYNNIMNNDVLQSITSGMAIIYAGNKVTRVSAELAAAFRPGDRLLVVAESGDLLHIPLSEQEIASAAVTRALEAFSIMNSITDDSISNFYHSFAELLANDEIWQKIVAANDQDVTRARERGRSTTRLVVNEKMRADMISGLLSWRDSPAKRNELLEVVEHEGWRVEQRTAPLGVVGFVFEGRPNVFADATGVLRSGNTVVFRIGSDALGTASTIVAEALEPALQRSGLPAGAVTLLASAAHAAGWALFSDSRLALAVARGSGRAVAQLGSVARQAGVAISLHGTGGAWIIADSAADINRFAAAVYHSLDRKVCNTLNVCAIIRSAADKLLPTFLAALERAGERRGQACRLHIAEESEHPLLAPWLAQSVTVHRASGDVVEPKADYLPISELSREWEWEETPEISLLLIDSIAEAAELFNRYSPQFVVSIISENQTTQEEGFALLNAPFTGNGFTRWVDGQYSLCRPELGLSNWQNGRLFARGGILSGDGVYTIRTQAILQDPEIHR